MPGDGKALAKKKKLAPERMTRLEELDIDVFLDNLNCSLLDIHRAYDDEAIEELRSRLTEKLGKDLVSVIGRLRISAPAHIHVVFDVIRSFSIQVENIKIDSSFDSLQDNDWVGKALSFKDLESITLHLSEAKDSRRDLIKSIIDRSLTIKEVSIRLTDEGSKRGFIDHHIITDDYLLNLAKTMKREVTLDIRASLLTPDGFLPVVEAMTERTDEAKLSVQIYNSQNARDIKNAILNHWKLTDEIDKRFKSRNRARKVPSVFDQFLMFNEEEMICVFDGKVLVKMPTEEIVKGEAWSWRLPFKLIIERVHVSNPGTMELQDMKAPTNKGHQVPPEIARLAQICKRFHCSDGDCTGPSAESGGFAAFPTATPFYLQCGHLWCSLCKERHNANNTRVEVQCGICRVPTRYQSIARLQKADDITAIINELSQRGLPCPQCAVGGSVIVDDSSSVQAPSICCWSRPSSITPAETVPSRAPDTRVEQLQAHRVRYFHRDQILCCLNCSPMGISNAEDSYQQWVQRFSLVCTYCVEEGRSGHKTSSCKLTPIVKYLRINHLMDRSLDMGPSSKLLCKNRANWHLSMGSEETMAKIDALNDQFVHREISDDESTR